MNSSESDVIPSPFRILVFEGGPSGFVTIRLLEKVEQAAPGFLEKTNLFFGVSNGALISLSLIYELSVKKVSGLEAIRNCIKFTEDYARAFRPGPCDMIRFLSGLGPLLLPDGLQRVLDRYFGSATLGEVTRQDPGQERMVSILGLDATAWAPATFHAFKPGDQGSLLLRDAALASSACPMLFPIFLFSGNPGDTDEERDGHRFLDGGLVSNNPVMGAVHDALLFLWRERGGNSEHYQEIPKLRLLSFGGTPPPWEKQAVEPPVMTAPGEEGKARLAPLHWGWLAWLLRPVYLVELMVHGDTNYGDRHCGWILGNRFFRFAPEMPLFPRTVSLMFRNSEKQLEALQKDADAIWKRETGKRTMLLEFARDQWGCDGAMTNPSFRGSTTPVPHRPAHHNTGRHSSVHGHFHRRAEPGRAGLPEAGRLFQRLRRWW